MPPVSLCPPPASFQHLVAGSLQPLCGLTSDRTGHITHLLVSKVRPHPALLPRVAEQRCERPEAKVIVILLGQLLYCQGVQGEDLLRQDLRKGGSQLKDIFPARTGKKPARAQPTSTLQLLNPSPKRIISAMSVESGTTMAMGRNMDLRLSGSSVRPA